jgi:hypothetical protein
MKGGRLKSNKRRMKFIVLTDGTNGDFEQLVNETQGKQSLVVDTENCDKDSEYEYLSETIDYFSLSDNEIMLVKFSGKEDVVKNLGDLHPEMIISLSYNKKSKYYTEYPVDMFSNLITIFK